MSYSFLQTRKGQYAALVIAVCAAAVAACSGPSPVGPPLQGTSGLRSGAASPATKAKPTPYDFQFQTVDDPGSSQFNEATSINQLGSISGNYGSGSQSDPSHGWITMPPYTKFRQVDYPGAVDTYLQSMSTDHLRAGYFLDNTKQHNTLGWVENKGIFTFYKDPKTPKEPQFIDQLLCINGTDIAVGFYEDDYGNDVPFELIATQNRYTPLAPPSARSAQATTVNLRGDVAGVETTNGGAIKGWFLRGGVYTTFSYPGATSTTAYGLDFVEQVVGSYVDSSGATHGFVLTNPTSASGQFWQSVDEPQAAGTTVITSMNAQHAIAGWYLDSQNVRHGFTAVVSGSKVKAR
ncbi:MAG TPA: hypothetical protein VMT95_08045 [Candidatus Binatia bacterium]|nr:hypothetical protein [Candidatus Binatia bacterium]